MIAPNSRVLVAMSGGVDSSVTAALLKEQGHDVIGATMHIWSPSWGHDAESCPHTGGARGCCGYEAIDDARRVAHRLGVPHYVFDLREEFEEAVVADFCAEYARGRTPNPCIRCNRFLKFDILLKRAHELDADYVATGHYAQVEIQNPKSKIQNRSPRYQLRRPRDRAKDQTYFLYFLKQRQLAHILFPLGELTKPEVRKHARELGLTVADKKESQEVCFAPGGTYPDFLKSRFPELARPGAILDASGKIIGRHQGIIHYTIGQRKRIGIARAQPLYVVAIDPENNTVTVGDKREIYGREMKVENVSYVSRPGITGPGRVEIQIRYQSKPVSALITPLGRNAVLVRLDEPQWAITPGQAAVFYEGDTVIGGGTISREVKTEGP